MPDPDSSQPHVVAVVCTFRPEIGLLREQLQCVAPQVTSLWVVDDGTEARELESLRACIADMAATWPHVRLIETRENRGLAAAINVGVRLAANDNASHCLLLDQDSVPDSDMVAKLLDAETKLLDQGVQLAGIGPRLEIMRSSRERLPLITTLKALTPVELLVTSGSLIRLAVLGKVGPMDESLFIDNVDLDWSFRAHALGLGTFVADCARMRHCIGERRRIVGGLDIVVHAPDRLYYMTRNRMRLYARPYVPWGWIVRDLPRLIGKLAVFSLVIAPRRANAAAMLEGIMHALNGRAGRRRGLPVKCRTNPK